MWLSLLLAGCGGGGGGAPDTTSPTGPTTDTIADGPANAPATGLPEGWETSPEVWAAEREFANQPGLKTIKAQEAYAQGIAGRGQVIGFIDNGLDENHPEFAGKNIALNDRSGVSNIDNTQLSHGTGVASIALGARRRRGPFELGWIGEAKGLMNSIGDGALKLGPSHSAIFTVGTDYDLSEDLSVTANAHLTFSELLPFSDSLIRGTERAVSSAFDKALNYENFNLQLSQPTYFETGILKLSRPERRREDGSVVFRNDEISLRSPERPVLLSLTREGDASRFGLKVEKHSGLPTQYKLAYQLKL